jgi:pantoate--beta-alanine ligase
MIVAATFAEARAGRRVGHPERGTVGFVPTMGALHAGHRSLMTAARRRCDTLVVSIFVNPLQFNDPADLARYPRTFEADLRMCEEEGVDVVFAPSGEEMYPRPMLTAVAVKEVPDRMEGPNRPGHFDGVATVVAKLFAGIQPDLAFFGRKDAQQLAVITTMATDLGFPIEIVGCPTLREPGGLAMSSRNVFLSGDERIEALALSRGLMRAADAVEAGERNAIAIEEIARSDMTGLHPEYVELAGQERAERLDTLDRPAFLAVAARVGVTRLIDNVAFDRIGDRFVADRGIIHRGGS